jgi:ATP-dependent helicase/nuclease subunit A
MVILLRSPQNKAEAFAKEFSRLGIPLVVARGGFFDSPEIRDLLALLSLLDNPLQDIPLLTVLRSPVVALTLDELALVRLAAKGKFWHALEAFRRQPEIRTARAGDGQSEQPDARQRLADLLRDSKIRARAQSAWTKIDLFLSRYSEWRRAARQTSLSQALDRILAETQYAALLLAQPNGAQRRGNVSKLLNWARQFDQFQRQGLFRFLKFVEAQRDADLDREPAPVDTADAVRLLSIHQSKGLEFPVVVVADLGKPFNLVDLKGDIILDEHFGLCPMVKPPFTEQRYPSLPYWLAQRRQRQELLGEEMRLLYVAMTRACQILILTGTIARSSAEAWSKTPATARPTRELMKARTFLDWVGPWLAEVIHDTTWSSRIEGHCHLFQWHLEMESDAQREPEPARKISAGPTTKAPTELNQELLVDLAKRLTRTYPFQVAIDQPAKRSVSMLRQTVLIDEEETGGLRPARPRRASKAQALSAAEIGEAHHLFLQLLPLTALLDRKKLALEADRLEQKGVLSPAARACLDLDAIASFWNSEVGRKILQQQEHLNVEIPFTARLTLKEVLAFQGAQSPAELGTVVNREFVILTGVVDLAVLMPKEIWILDFKTDAVNADTFARWSKQYEPQLQLYSMALSRVYGRPVTQCWLHSLMLRRTLQLAAAT